MGIPWRTFVLVAHDEEDTDNDEHGVRDDMVQNYDDMEGNIYPLMFGATIFQQFEEDANKFATLFSGAQCEFYPSCKKYSKLSFLVKFLHLKTS